MPLLKTSVTTCGALHGSCCILPHRVTHSLDPPARLTTLDGVTYCPAQQRDCRAIERTWPGLLAVFAIFGSPLSYAFQSSAWAMTDLVSKPQTPAQVQHC